MYYKLGQVLQIRAIITNWGIIHSKFADLKEKFVKELKEDLLSSITSLINEKNSQIENLNDKLTKQNSIISVLQNNVEVLNEQ